MGTVIRPCSKDYWEKNSSRLEKYHLHSQRNNLCHFILAWLLSLKSHTTFRQLVPLLTAKDTSLTMKEEYTVVLSQRIWRTVTNHWLTSRTGNISFYQHSAINLYWPISTAFVCEEISKATLLQIFTHITFFACNQFCVILTDELTSRYFSWCKNTTPYNTW